MRNMVRMCNGECPIKLKPFIRAYYQEVTSMGHLDLPWPPGLVEPWLKWAVEPQDDPPALAGEGLYPIGFMARRRFRAEIDVPGGVRINDDALLLATEAGESLIA
jgi:hypothetical protein